MNIRNAIDICLEFSRQEPFILIKWVLLFCFLIVLFILFYSENFKFPKNIHQVSQSHLQSVLAIARRRGWYALILFMLYLITVIAYDITMVRKNKVTEDSQKPIVVESSQEQKSDVKILPEQSLKKSNDVDSLFNNVTVFSEKNGQSESAMDLLKQRYEPMLVTYFILENCKMTENDTFLVLQDKILEDIVKVSGNADNLANFIEASRGSYDEMYKNYDCTKPELIKMKANFDANIQLGENKPETSPAAK